MVTTLTLTTLRLVLRPWNIDDAEQLFELASDPEIGPCAGWSAHTSVEESRSIIKNVLTGACDFGITLKDTGELVGAASLKLYPSSDLCHNEREAELGYWIGKKYWGQGFAPEASAELLRYGFENLHLDCVWCAHQESNTKSARVMSKLGFVFDSMRPNVYYSLIDQYHNHCIRRLTKDEWIHSDRLDTYMISSQQQEADAICCAIPHIAKVISGGQTGADRAGLDAAIAQNVAIGGWCPLGGLAEDCITPPGVLALYPELKQTSSISYVERTALNVRDSHATLIVAPDGLIRFSGTEMTKRFADAYGRPCKVVRGTEQVDDIIQWIESLPKGITLNIAGPRENKCKGVYKTAYMVVSQILEKLK